MSTPPNFSADEGAPGTAWNLTARTDDWFGRDDLVRWTAALLARAARQFARLKPGGSPIVRAARVPAPPMVNDGWFAEGPVLGKTTLKADIT